MIHSEAKSRSNSRRSLVFAAVSGFLLLIALQLTLMARGKLLHLG
ncbi:MAG: hypothetical protein ACRYFU_02625 [Janthinobacterium lividum]